MHNKRKYKCKLGKGLSSGMVHSIPISCAFALLLLGIVVINPASNSNSAFADNANNMARSSTVNTTLSMVIDNDTPMNPTYAEPGKTAYRSHIVKVSATDIMNYTLQLTAADGATTTLNNGNTAIPGTSAVTGKDMSSNTWGFTWGEVNSDNSEQTYYALPAYGSTGANMSTGLLESAQASDSNTADFTKKLTFAANLAEGSPSGHYTTTALLSLAATPKQLVFDGIETMQEMTSTICANAEENDTTRLRDSRDGKYYWVAKLKDGNCWMTQNLALDLTNITLTPQDSDVAEDWTPNLTSELWGTEGGEELTEHDIKIVNYYNPGDIVWAEVRMPNSSSDWCFPLTDITKCANYKFVNVADLEPSNTPDMNTIVDQNRGIYDAHYLTGNYYSANAATANTGINTQAGHDVSSTICPSNWQLPASIDGLNGTYSNTSEGLIVFLKSPIYLVASGSVSDMEIEYPGFTGYYWMPRVERVLGNLGNQAYSLRGFSYSGTLKMAGLSSLSNDNGSNAKWSYDGASIRCVAR